jgi:hypothetical protein
MVTRSKTLMVPQSDKEIGDVRMTPARLGQSEKAWLGMGWSSRRISQVEYRQLRTSRGCRKRRKGRSSRFERVI